MLIQVKAGLAGIVATIALVIMTSAIVTTTNTVILAQGNQTSQPTTTTSSIQGGFANIQTVQDENHIAITITKSGAPPNGPVIIVPPGGEGGKNGTILTPGDNGTKNNTTNTGSNVTAPTSGNVTIIDQKGNITEVPNGNVTNVNNNTVVVAPVGQNVTVTPANVTVIDPPVKQPPVPTCSCEQQNQTTTPVNGPNPPAPPLTPSNNTNGTVSNKTG